MNSAEFEAAMNEIGLTQGEVARRLNVRTETVNRWLRGVKGIPRKISGPAAAAISAWLKEKRRLSGPPIGGSEGGMS
jgi:DNA-binding transcriptional regulator YiaG